MLYFVNLNDYLGGGETLLVRIAESVKKDRTKVDSTGFICAQEGYIMQSLRNLQIKNVLTLRNDYVDYYYKSEAIRKEIINSLQEKIDSDEAPTFVTFCMQDLYLITQLTKRFKNAKVVHLILHYLDNRYLCQSLFDKFISKFFHKERFSRVKQLSFNNKIMTLLNENGALIPMGEMCVDMWKQLYGISIPMSNVVPLPCFDFPKQAPELPRNNHKIICIGRLVNFKLASVCALLNFVKNHQEYSVTIVGNGEMAYLKRYISENHIPASQVSFVGEVPYNQLGDLIKQHSIGYAMGTSIVEICRYGLPGIVALGSPGYNLFKFDKDICGGLLFNCGKGVLGEHLYLESSDDQVLLEDVFAQIENDYDGVAMSCYQYAKDNYDVSVNLNHYLQIIEQANPTNFSQLDISYPSLLRKITKKYIRR